MWEIHQNLLLLVLSVARDWFEALNYSALPDDLKRKIMNQLSGSDTEHEAMLQAFDLFCLTPAAPWALIQSAYEIMSKELRDHDQKQQLADAYTVLEAAFNKSV
jgi:hypothetical protein